jgi:NADH:ubiquinone reductase (H+-translocating)
MAGTHLMQKHVAVIGAGFGGLSAVKELAGHPEIRVTWIDRQNYHLFLPLLYQVATATVEAPDIAQPARDVLRKHRNVRFVLGSVDLIDRNDRTVWVDGAPINYDVLIVATGSETAKLGVPGVDDHAHGLKYLDEAMAIRERLVSACEEAAQTSDEDRIRSLLSFAIVGGGPTGVEMAGALAEFRLHVMPRVYPEIDPQLCRIVLIDSSDRPLSVLSKRTSAYARRTLEGYGVEMRLDTRVGEVTETGVVTEDGEQIDAFTVIWAAGVKGAPIEGLPEADRRGRIATTRALALEGDPDVFIAGDLNGLVNPSTGKPYPQVAAVATQQGVHAARNALLRIDGRPVQDFTYRNYGTMITIGRHKAAVERGALRITGFLAWIAWLIVHLMKLVGVRNRLMVLLSWLHMYFTRDFAVRVLLRRHRFPRTSLSEPKDDFPAPKVPADGPDPNVPSPGELFASAQEEDREHG